MKQYLEFINEKLGISKSVLELKEIILNKFKDMKSDNTVYYFDGKKLPYPFNKLKYIKLKIGDKAFYKKQEESHYGSSDTIYMDNENSFIGVLKIRKEYLIDDTLLHELTHLYQDCLQLKKSSLTLRYKQYFDLTYIDQNEIDDEIDDDIKSIRDFIYYTTPEETSARITEIYHKIENYEGRLTKKEFLEILENDYSYQTYLGIYNDVRDYIDDLINDNRSFKKVEKILDKYLSDYKIKTKSFLIKLGIEAERNAQKFLRKAHKLYYFTDEEDFVKFPSVFKHIPIPKEKVSIGTRIKKFIKKYIKK